MSDMRDAQTWQKSAAGLAFAVNYGLMDVDLF